MPSTKVGYTEGVEEGLFSGSDQSESSLNFAGGSGVPSMKFATSPLPPEIENAAENTGVSANVLLSIIRYLQDPVTGTKLQIDELLCWDINYWLTAAQIADARNPNGPTLNTTAAIQYAHDQLIAKFASEPTNKNGSFCGILHFHNSYLVDGFMAWNQGIGVAGDNMRDTFFLQSSTPQLVIFNVLAPQGRDTDSHAPYWIGRDFAVFGNKNVLSAGALCTGIALPNGVKDGDAYGGCQLDRVQIYGFSGNCFFIDIQRHAPKLRFCHFSAGGGVSLIGDGSDYASVVKILTRSDGEMLHCGAGGGNGHTVEIQNCDTIQIKGGDYWSSAHAEQGYYAFQVSKLNYMICEGADVNGAFNYRGQANDFADFPFGKSSQLRLVNINFRFRRASFGENQDGSGTPAPLDAYIILHDSVNTESLGCTFTPYFDNTKAVVARPRWLYSMNGSESRHVARDHLVDIASNDWPAGADVSGALITPTLQNSLSNALGQVSFDLSIITEATGFHGILTKYLNFIDGVNSGIVGRLDSHGAAPGCVGEQIQIKVAPGAQVSCGTSGTVTNICLITLTAGDWDVWGEVVFSTNDASAFNLTKEAMCLSMVSTADFTANDASSYSIQNITVASPASGSGVDLASLATGPTRVLVASGSTQNIWLNARPAMSVNGKVSAWGNIRALRTV